jgi:hypothetical protein
MIPVVKEGYASLTWGRRRFQVPSIHLERNAWKVFNNRFEKTLKAKQDFDKNTTSTKEAKNQDELDSDATHLMLNQTCVDISDDEIKPNSVDFLLTDPPFGGDVQFLELTTLWNAWLNNDVSYEDEITINSKQNKDTDYYHNMLDSSFSEFYKKVKPGKWAVIMFHSTETEIFNSLIKAATFNGFKLEKILHQPRLRDNVEALNEALYGRVTGFFVLQFKKPKKKSEKPVEKELKSERYEKIVINTAKQVIAERGEPTAQTIIRNEVRQSLQDQGGFFTLDTEEPMEIMERNVGNEFEKIPRENEDGEIVDYEWWLASASSVKHLNEVPLTERVEEIVIDVLKSNTIASFEEIIKYVFINFDNAMTPNPPTVKEALEEYALRKNDKWKLDPAYKETQSQHDTMIYQLAKIGEKLGYDIWIGKPEQSSKIEGTPLSSLSLDDKNLKIPYAGKEIESIKNIDTLWIKNGEIEYAFEVEHTTKMIESVNRGSNLDTDSVKQIFAIPEERKSLLQKRMEDPWFRKKVSEDGWKISLYDEIEAIFNNIDSLNSDQMMIAPHKFEEVTDQEFNTTHQSSVLSFD